MVDCDIYIVAHVESLKKERRELQKRIKQLTHENALLSEQLDRFRRDAAFTKGLPDGKR